MTLKELMKFIDSQSEWLKVKYPDELNPKQRGLLRMVKLTEEVGELAEQVLGVMKQQRKKVRKMDSDSLAEEIADVLVTTLLLASVMKINVEDLLRAKIKKIESRRKP